MGFIKQVVQYSNTVTQDNKKCSEWFSLLAYSLQIL